MKKKLKEQLIFNKKQEIYIKLYQDLNEFWEVLDYERVQFHINTDPIYRPCTILTYEDFSKLHRIVSRFHSSPDFLYMPPAIQKIINNFIEYVNSNLEDYHYEKYENIERYHNAAKILSDIYPLLKQEIGLITWLLKLFDTNIVFKWKNKTSNTLHILLSETFKTWMEGIFSSSRKNGLS